MNNNNADDEMLFGEWMDLDTNDTTTNNNNNSNRSHDESKVTKRIAVDPPLSSTTASALSASFDFSLLSSSNNRYGDNDKQQQQQLFTPTLLRYASSWDDGDIPRRMDSCKRTKLQRGVEESSSSSLSLHKTHLSSASHHNPQQELFLGGGGGGGSSSNSGENSTVRKARHSFPASPQQQQQQQQHQTAAAASASRQQSRSVNHKKGNTKKLTPASAKRHRASLHHHHHHHRSPMRRVPPLTPRASELNNNNSTNTLGSTAATTTTTTANFSSIKQPRRPKVSLGTIATAASSTLLETTTDTLDSADTLESNTPFRFTSFPASLPRIHTTTAASAASEEEGNAVAATAAPPTVRKRMTFGSNDHASHHQQHQQQYLRSYLKTAAADDDTHNTSVSSLHHEDDDDDEDGTYAYSDDDNGDHGPILSPRTRLDFQQMQSPVVTAVAAGAADANDSASTTSTMPRQRQQQGLNHHHHPQESVGDLNSSYLSSAATEKANACLDHHSPRLFDHHHHASKSLLPRGNSMDLELQLDSAQCSPIPGNSEEATSPSGGGGGGGGRPNTSASSASTCRPLPDLNAFDDDNDQNGSNISSNNNNNRSNNTADRSTDESGISSGRSHPSSPKLLCPPTPERTPAWAHQVDHYLPQQDSYALFSSSSKQHHHHHTRRQRPPRRANSLIETKVLATCELPMLDGNSFEQQQQQQQEPLGAFAEAGRTPLAPRTTMTRKHHREHGLFPSHDDDNDDDGRDDDDHPNTFDDDVTQDTKEKAAAAAGDSDDDDSNNKHDDAPSISINFEPISLLGSGTFAEVYKVQSKLDGKLYALKRSRKMFRGQRDRERALLEVRCMQRLQHGKQISSSSSSNNTPSDSTYLLFFFQAWQQDGHFFCLTELCCRSTCRDLIDDFHSQLVPTRQKLPSIESLPSPVSNDGGSRSSSGGVRFLPDETIWKICHDIAAGLRHIHSHGLVHNDIKSSNIFMVLDHHFGPLCKIGDFGLTREAGFDDEEGDQKYMPSEVLDSGRKEASADIFSFGLMLYELAANLTFELPADGPRWHELRRGSHTLDVPACRSSHLNGIILSLIESNPGKRPTASHILDIEVVASSLHDKGFLQAYIADIEQLDRMEEDRNAVSHSCADQTPRNVPARTRSCSPSMGNLPAAPLIYSPEAALS